MSRGAGSSRFGLAAATLAAALGVVGAPSALFAEAPPALRLADREGQLPCARVEGEIVVLVDPQRGVLVLSTRELAGSERVGTVTDGTARFSVPGLRMKELVVDGAAGDGRTLELWGQIVAGAAPAADCFGLPWRDAEDVAALRARVNELVAQRARDRAP